MTDPTPADIARGWRPVGVARTFGSLIVVHGAREPVGVQVNTEPCPAWPCHHRDCAVAFEIAATECTACPEPIGYGRYRLGYNQRDLLHEDCWTDLTTAQPEPVATLAQLDYEKANGL